MKKYLITTLSLLFSSVIHAQGIVGKVVDLQTGKPIESATIISGDNATLTNKDGEYALKSVSGSVEFSHVVYHSQSFSANAIPDVVRLDPRAMQLEDIEVKANSSLSQNIKKVWNKYRSVDRSESQHGRKTSAFYYRQITKTESAYTEYIESFLSGYRGLAIDALAVREGRYAAISTTLTDCIRLANHYFFSQLFPVTMSKKLGSDNIMAPLSYNYEKSYRVSYIKSINPDGEDEIKVYRFEPIPPFPKNTAVLYGDIYVRSRDNAIMQFDGVCDNFRIRLADSRFRFVGMELNFVIKYSDSNDYKYPIIESVKTDANIYFRKILANGSFSKPINAKIESILFNIDWKFEGNADYLGTSTEFNKKILDMEYNPKFWEDNPIIKRTAIEDKIIQDFTKSGYFGNFKIE